MKPQHRRVALSAGLLCIITSAGVAQTTGLPFVYAPGRSPWVKLRAAPTVSSSALGTLWTVMAGLGMEWQGAGVRVQARVADLGSNASLRSAFGVVSSYRLLSDRVSWRTRLVAGVGRSVIRRENERVRQVDVPVGVGWGWVPGTPFGQVSLWWMPRLQYRNMVRADRHFDQFGGGISLGLDLDLASRAREPRSVVFGPWLQLDVLRIGGDGLAGRTEYQASVGAALRYHRISH